MDSSSTALLVGIMCQRLFTGIVETTDVLANKSSQSGGTRVPPDETMVVLKQTPTAHLLLKELRRIIKKPDFVPKSGQDICYELQKYRARRNCIYALQIYFSRQISITNFICSAGLICKAIHTSAIMMLLQIISAPNCFSRATWPVNIPGTRRGEEQRRCPR